MENNLENMIYSWFLYERSFEDEDIKISENLNNETKS